MKLKQVLNYKAGKSNQCAQARQTLVIVMFILKWRSFLFGASIQPLNVASTHMFVIQLAPVSYLLNKRELASLFGKANRDGFTIVALSLYWKSAWAKVKIGLAKGKKQQDKREDIKEREWKVAKEANHEKCTKRLVFSAVIHKKVRSFSRKISFASRNLENKALFLI